MSEEFAVLLPEAEPQVALTCAEEILIAVAALAVPALGGHRVTISGGVAPWSREVPQLEAWIGRADVALYAAKRNGRNQMRLSD